MGKTPRSDMMAKMAERRRKIMKTKNLKDMASDKTPMKVLVVRALETRGTVKFKYRTVICRSLEKKPSVIRYAPKRPKAGETLTEEQVAMNAELEKESITIAPGEEFRVNCIDAEKLARIKNCEIATMYLDANKYGEHNENTGFSCRPIEIDPATSNPLEIGAYKQFVMNTAVAEIPTRLTMSASNFPAGTNPKFMMRQFIAPLSSDTNAFASVLLCSVDEDTPPEQLCVKMERLDPRIGFNVEFGSGMSRNSFTVAYFPHDKKKRGIVVDYGTMYPEDIEQSPSVFECFGILDLDMWKSVAVRLAHNAEEWLVFAVSSHERVMRIAGNQDDQEYDVDYGYGTYDGDDGTRGGDGAEKKEGEEEVGGGDDDAKAANGEEAGEEAGEDKEPYDLDNMEQTTALVTKMNVNLAATVRKVGVELSRDYVTDFLQGYRYMSPIARHPVNGSYAVKLERRTGNSVINVTELQKLQCIDFMDMVTKAPTIKFYGVFATNEDRPYTFEGDTVEREEMLKAEGLKPAVIYAIV